MPFPSPCPSMLASSLAFVTAHFSDILSDLEIYLSTGPQRVILDSKVSIISTYNCTAQLIYIFKYLLLYIKYVRIKDR